MRELGDAKPKPLQSVGGMPLVERLLRGAVAAGLRDVSVITGWRGEDIRSHLLGLADLPGDLVLDFVEERTPRGNAGSLSRLPADDRPTILCFADLLTELDFAELVAVHRSQGADVTLTSHLESHRVRLGELLVEGERVVGYLEKPEKQIRICSGIGLFEAPVLALLPDEGNIGISDLVGLAIEAGFRVVHWDHGAFWMDVNTPEELAIASAALADRTGPGRGAA